MLTITVIVGTVVFPSYTTYDATYSLLWGREILHGEMPSFANYRAPTEHPLGLVFGMFFALFGRAGDRLMLLATLGSFIVMVMGLYRLGREAFTKLVGVVAAIIICTRFDFPFLAARGYIDIPYLALLLWAASMESARTRRGTPVLVLLTLAGLLRPEAWILAGLYWLWLFPALSWGERIRTALIVASAPIIWSGVDYIVTGDPLFSQNHTTTVSEELGRQKGIAEIPAQTLLFMTQLVKLPVVVAGVIGTVLACVLAPRRSRVPLALLVIGLATFLLLSVGGFSVINRYLLLPAVLLMLFAAFTAGGFTILVPGRMRTIWASAAALGVLFVVVWTVLRVDLTQLTSELRYRGTSVEALTSLLDEPAVRAGAKCGPVLTSNHRMIPSVRWIMDLPADQVIARSDVEAASKVKYGLVLLAAGRAAFLRGGLDPEHPTAADALRNLPPVGYQPIASNDLYSVYGRCR
ncbi:MAG: hypothetical protein F2813_06345 [Actinobacteria bacterium]|nr:hypothetical protein [Actinomycetota bacterium]